MDQRTRPGSDLSRRGREPRSPDDGWAAVRGRAGMGAAGARTARAAGGGGDWRVRAAHAGVASVVRALARAAVRARRIPGMARVGDAGTARVSATRRMA